MFYEWNVYLHLPKLDPNVNVKIPYMDSMGIRIFPVRKKNAKKNTYKMGWNKPYKVAENPWGNLGDNPFTQYQQDIPVAGKNHPPESTLGGFCCGWARANLTAVKPGERYTPPWN